MNGSNYEFDDNDMDNIMEHLLLDYDNGEDSESDSDSEANYKPLNKKQKIIDAYVTAAFDRAKVSDRHAAMITAAIIQSAGESLNYVSLNKDTVRRHKNSCREGLIEAISSHKIEGDTKLTLQWDGKCMTDPDNSTAKVDRLPVLISGENGYELLGIPKLPDGKADTQVDAIMKLLQDHNYDNKIGAMYFDTTNVNTGSHNGTCVRLEKELGVKLLCFACRHHIFELPLRAVFEDQLNVSTKSPDVVIFKKFREQWENIDSTNFASGLDDQLVSNALRDHKDQILKFAREQLEVNI